MERIGLRLLRRRQETGLSMAALAKAPGWTGQYWQLLETGRRQAPDLQSAAEVARALAVPVTDALLAQLLLEHLCWYLSGPAGGGLGFRLASKLLKQFDPTPENLEAQPETCPPLRQALNSYLSTSRKRQMDFRVSAPATWPRPLLVDFLLRNTSTNPPAGLALWPGGVDFAVLGSATPTTPRLKPGASGTTQFDESRHSGIPSITQLVDTVRRHPIPHYILGTQGPGRQTSEYSIVPHRAVGKSRKQR